MKLEKGSFTAGYNLETIILNDSTLTPNRIIFWIDGTYKSHGYDDMTRQVAAYGTSTATKNDRSIYLHNGSTAVMSGRCTAFYLGEFDVTFDVRTADTIHFLAIED